MTKGRKGPKKPPGGKSRPEAPNPPTAKKRGPKPTKPKEEPRFRVADIALHFLRKGEKENYAFHELGPEALKLALEALFLSGSEPVQELEELVALACILEADHKSPTAAATIENAIKNSEEAQAILRKSRPDRTALRKRFAKFSSEAIDRAPKYDEKRPEGSLKASSFMEPGKELRRPATPSAKKTAARKKSTKQMEPNQRIRGVKEAVEAAADEIKEKKEKESKPKKRRSFRVD